jgi:hypothetical protein
VAVEEEPVPTEAAARAAWHHGGRAGERVLEWASGTAEVGFAWAAPAVPSVDRADPRLVAFRVLLDDLAARLLHQVARELRGDPVLALLVAAR